MLTLAKLEQVIEPKHIDTDCTIKNYIQRIKIKAYLISALIWFFCIYGYAHMVK